jgi:L-threonylcarbamoyladenylate synthase
VIADLDGRVEIILAGPDCRVGIESTVVDMTTRPPAVLRPGILSAEDLSAAMGTLVEVDPALLKAGPDVRLAGAGGAGAGSSMEASTGSTGAGGSVEASTGSMGAGGSVEASTGGADMGGSAGAGGEAPRAPGMKYRHYAPNAEMIVVEGMHERVKPELYRLRAMNESLGRHVALLLFDEKDYLEAAQTFYTKLRELDAAGFDLILAGALSRDDGVGFAVMNRMMKAAGHRVVRV